MLQWLNDDFISYGMIGSVIYMGSTLNLGYEAFSSISSFINASASKFCNDQNRIKREYLL